MIEEEQQIPLDFEFLTWFERACMFRDDAREELTELGIDTYAMLTITTCDAFLKKHSLVAIYQDYGRIEPGKMNEVRVALDLWVSYNYKKYREICERLAI